MAVTFRKGLSSLLRDLSRGGFSVRLVERFADGKGRHADVHLYNDVILSWDAESQTLWAEGALRDCRKVERYLRARYSRRGLKRVCITGYYVATRLLRAPLHRLKSYLRHGPKSAPAPESAHSPVPQAAGELTSRTMQDRPVA